MQFSTKTLILGAALACAPAAFAQTAPAPAAPATAPAAQAAAPVTDGEVTQYAAAALAVDKIRKDAAIPEADKNAKLVEAITGSGLTAERFNAISQAMGSDPALNKRIQEAAAVQLKASPQGGK